MDDKRKAIKKTIEYAKRYGVKLTNDQLWQRLLSAKKVSKKEIEKRIFLSKKTKSEVNASKIEKVKELVDKYLKKIKTVEMVAVTGSVAAESAKREDDIDLLIVCQPGSLWLSRLMVWLTVLKYKIPHRRYGQTEKKDEFCFNLWLETDSLTLPIEKQNQKNAVDGVMMKIIYDPNGVENIFYKDNRWIGYFCANGYFSRLKKTKEKRINQPKLIMKFLNQICYWAQSLLIKSKRGLKTSLKQAFFHGI